MNDYRIIAELHLLSADQGGRKAAFRVGFRPQFYITSPEVSTSCFIDRIENKESMAPGETGNIEARLLNPQFFEGQLDLGARFELCEAGRAIGWGIIKKIEAGIS